jgi:hypothetical protein
VERAPAIRPCRSYTSPVSLDSGTVQVVSSLTETDTGVLLVGPPKSAAGRRTIHLPPLVLPSLRNHLDRYAQPRDDGLVFVGPNGCQGPLRSALGRS